MAVPFDTGAAVGASRHGGSPRAARDAAWARELDRLDSELHRTGQLLELGEDDEAGERAEHADWTVPADLGPLPVQQLERAASLLARQREMTRRLAERMVSTTRHQDLVEGLGSASGRAHRPAVYVDVSA